MPSGFKTYSASVQVDLDDVLKPIGATTARQNVGFVVGSTDISQRYKAATTEGSKVPFNVYYKSGSTDLGQLFMFINYAETTYYILTVYSGSGGGSKESGSYAPITASTSPAHYHFDTWLGSGITSATSAQTTVLMDTDKIVSASYVIDQYTLVVTNGTGDDTQNYGYTYTIVADAAPSHKHFTLWTSAQSPTFVNGTSAINSTANIQISENTTITSNYDWNTYVLTVTYGSGDGTYAYNANMTIIADAAPTYQHFANWINTAGSLSFANAASSTTTANFTADGNATAEATYAWNDYTITISGDSGVDYTSPSIGSHTVQYPNFPYSVTAVIKYDYDFIRWVLDGNNVGSANPYSITSVGNHTLAAVTSLKNVAFTLSDDGHGNPTANYSAYPSFVPIHTTVSITPNPDYGYYFNYISADNSAIVSSTNVQLQGVGITNITVYYSAYTPITYATWDVTPNPYPGTSGMVVNLSVSTDGAGTKTYEWYYSTDGSSYTQVAVDNSNSHNYGNIYATTYFLCVVKNGNSPAGTNTGIATVPFIVNI